jgi:hypothetical protein
MIIKQLTSPVEVVEAWPKFAQGLRIVAAKSREELNEAAMLKTVLWLVNDPKIGYVNIAHNGSVVGGFSIWQDSTPPFVDERTFIARAIYGAPSAPNVLMLLFSAFERWAQGQGVKRFIVSTRRHSGAALRHFQSPKYGFSKGALTFEKVIT